MAISIKVNGKSHSVPAEPDTPLLYVLRNDLGLNGPKFGCGLGQCGACTVLLNAEPTRSCVTPVGDVGSEEVTTLEVLAPSRSRTRCRRRSSTRRRRSAAIAPTA